MPRHVEVTRVRMVRHTSIGKLRRDRRPIAGDPVGPLLTHHATHASSRCGTTNQCVPPRYRNERRGAADEASNEQRPRPVTSAERETRTECDDEGGEPEL